MRLAGNRGVPPAFEVDCSVVETASRANNPHMAALACHNAIVHGLEDRFVKPNHSQLHDLVRRGVEFARSNSDIELECDLRIDEARVLVDEGSVDHAIEVLESARALVRTRRPIDRTVAAAIGVKLLELGNFRDAANYLAQAIDQAHGELAEATTPSMRSQILQSIGELPRANAYALAMSNRLREAVDCLEWNRLEALFMFDAVRVSATRSRPDLTAVGCPVAVLISCPHGACWVLDDYVSDPTRIDLSVSSANIVAIAIANMAATDCLTFDDNGYFPPPVSPGILAASLNLISDDDVFRTAWEHFETVGRPHIVEPLACELRRRGIRRLVLSGPTILPDLPIGDLIDGVETIMSPGLRFSCTKPIGQRCVPIDSEALEAFVPFPNDPPGALTEAIAEVAIWGSKAAVAIGSAATARAVGSSKAMIRIIPSHGNRATMNGAVVQLFDGGWSPFAVSAGESFHDALIVLNTCTGSIAGAEEIHDSGLRAPTVLLVRGARAVVATRWPTRDDAALVFGCRFVELLKAKSDLVSAFHGAKTWLRDATAGQLENWSQGLTPAAHNLLDGGGLFTAPASRPFTDPIHWANYVLWV
jgi:hypothetical protein